MGADPGAGMINLFFVGCTEFKFDFSWYHGLLF